MKSIEVFQKLDGLLLLLTLSLDNIVVTTLGRCFTKPSVVAHFAQTNTEVLTVVYRVPWSLLVSGTFFPPVSPHFYAPTMLALC